MTQPATFDAAKTALEALLDRKLGWSDPAKEAVRFREVTERDGAVVLLAGTDDHLQDMGLKALTALLRMNNVGGMKIQSIAPEDSAAFRLVEMHFESPQSCLDTLAAAEARDKRLAAEGITVIAR